MKVHVEAKWPDGLPEPVLDLLLDEADRALLDVEARVDDVGRRYASLDNNSSELDELRLAIAELSDAYPGMQYELESIGDRLRNVGAISATAELEQRPHIVNLVRMSLEVFFRQYPTQDAYEAQSLESEDGPEEDDPSPAEAYETYRQLLEILRRRVN